MDLNQSSRSSSHLQGKKKLSLSGESESLNVEHLQVRNSRVLHRTKLIISAYSHICGKPFSIEIIQCTNMFDNQCKLLEAGIVRI